ncbi:hypothetical protein [Sphingomonas sp. Leaf257]|uniref:hypothetical protein n=1 Tax=Sphingomonas sp. Leaf257 TaxID=1736309 RepID=UPI0006FA05D6|nr:hypothetical protein [Sphingomonas sp. Leaf257]
MRGNRYIPNLIKYGRRTVPAGARGAARAARAGQCLSEPGAAGGDAAPLLEQRSDIVIPRDNRQLVERALHPQALAVIQREGGAAWINHGNMLAASPATSAWALRRD